ncbi:WG repeat-containing protein [Chitinophaga caseinilytica]|uniref:WG repeat-containing protein n=1 Tax=Chitinophaga caseinilytica TaxID=2267521 RepID=UPI003C30222B
MALASGCQPKQPSSRQEGKADTLRPKLEKLAGHLDSVNNIWVADDTRYSPDPFSSPESPYATVSIPGDTAVVGLINRKGEIVVPIRYHQISLGFAYGLNNVGIGDKHGLVNEYGQEVVPPVYDYIAMDVEDSLIRIGMNDKYGLIDLQGKVVIPLEYADVKSVGEGMVAVMKEPQRWGIVNLKNERIHPPVFTYTDRFVNGVVTLQQADGEDYLVYANGTVKKK